MATPARPTTPLGRLGRLPGEVRNRIYELVLPQEQERQFGSKRFYLPGHSPDLMRTSKAIRAETLMLYLWLTNWTVEVKHKRLGKGYHLCSLNRRCTTLGKFHLKDVGGSATINEDTPFLRQITFTRSTPGWPALTFAIGKGPHHKATVRHGANCPACFRAEWDEWAEQLKEARQKAVEDAQSQNPQSMRDKMIAYIRQYHAVPIPEGEAMEELQRRYMKKTAKHDKLLASLSHNLLRGVQIGARGFSVAHLRVIASHLTGDVCSSLDVQDSVMAELRRLWRQMNSEDR